MAQHIRLLALERTPTIGNEYFFAFTVFQTNNKIIILIVFSGNKSKTWFLTG
jgi:hypothetical protein